MSSTNWYFRSSGKPSGPYTSSQLKQLAEHGHITPTTEVRRESDQNWVAASRVKGLFDVKKTADMPTAILSASKSENSKSKMKDSAGKPFIWATIATGIVGLVIGLFFFFASGKRDTDGEIAIRNASQAMESGRIDDAENIINTVLQSDVKDKTKALELSRRIAETRSDQEVFSLTTTVDEDLKKNDFESAKKSLRSIIDKASSQDSRESAKTTLQEIEKVLSDDYARNIIERLPDEQLAGLLSAQEIPHDLVLSNPTLKSLLIRKCMEVALVVDEGRKKTKLAANEEKNSVANSRATAKELSRIDNINGLQSLVLSSDRKLFAGCDDEKKEIHIWDIDDISKKLTLKLPPQTRFNFTTNSIAISSDLKCIIAVLDTVDTSGATGPGLGIGEIVKETALGYWDLASGEFRGFFENPNPAGFSFRGRVVATNKFALCIAANNDKTGGGEYPLVQIWRLSDGKCHGSFRGHSKEIQCISILPESNRAITGGDDRIAILWEIDSGKEIRVFDQHQSSVQTLSISQDERSLVSGSFDCSIIHWDLQTGEVKSKWQLGEYDTQQEANWRAELFNWKLKILRGQSAGAPPIWLFPTVARVDLSPKGNEVLACLSVKDPLNLKSPSNPVLINLESGSIIALPSEFNRIPMHVSWAAFNHDASAIIFNRRRVERLRGQETTIEYLSIFGSQ
jgi:WD40 repeat protein